MLGKNLTPLYEKFHPQRCWEKILTQTKSPIPSPPQKFDSILKTALEFITRATKNPKSADIKIFHTLSTQRATLE